MDRSIALVSIIAQGVVMCMVHCRTTAVLAVDLLRTNDRKLLIKGYDMAENVTINKTESLTVRKAAIIITAEAAFVVLLITLFFLGQYKIIILMTLLASVVITFILGYGFGKLKAEYDSKKVT